MRTSRAAAPLVLVTLLAAGCGGGSESKTATAATPTAAGSSSAAPSAATSAAPSSSAPATGGVSAVGAVQAAGQRSGTQGSSRFVQTTLARSGGIDATVAVSGVLDYGRKTGALTVTVGPAGKAGMSIQERIVGNDLYVAAPQQPGTFYRLRLKDLVGTSLGSSTDPTAGFQALKAASPDVREVGKERVREADTTHYRGTYDARAAVGKVDGVAKQLFASTLKGSNLKAVPFDVWIDTQGRVRKLVQRLTVMAAGRRVDTNTTVEAYDYGIAVSVAAPPAAQVKDGAPLLKALKGAPRQ